MNASELNELRQYADKVEHLERLRANIGREHYMVEHLERLRANIGREHYMTARAGSTDGLREAERIARLIRQAVKELEAGGAR